MNLHFAMRRLLGRPTGVLHRTVQVASCARIVNIGGPDERITVGARTVIKGELLVFRHGGRIEIGQWSFVGEGTRIWSGASIVVGDRVMISHQVNILDNLTHPMSAAARHAHFREIVTTGHPAHIDLGDQPVYIEDDAWVAAGASVLRGVRVGRGAVVGTGAVVTHDVPPFCVVAGNPARVIRELPHESSDLIASSGHPGAAG
jgi:acetyltransferase-like isoleucine patch superfamily enzyme